MHIKMAMLSKVTLKNDRITLEEIYLQISLVGKTIILKVITESKLG